MDKLSSDDDSYHRTDRFESYADVISSKSCASFSYVSHAVITPLTSSPLAEPQSDSDSYLSAPPPIMLPVFGGRHVVIPVQKPKKLVVVTELTEVELMRERFAKLLLGEDMSGGGKGVCAALAISNAITNLSATVFKDLWKLDPLAPQRKSMWTRDMEWLLSDVGQSILESYSRVLESLAFNIMVRIDDLLYIDDATKRCRAVETVSMLAQRDLTTSIPLQKPISSIPFSSPLSPIMTTPASGSSNSNNGSANRRHCFVRTSSLRDPLTSNFERPTF